MTPSQSIRKLQQKVTELERRPCTTDELLSQTKDNVLLSFTSAWDAPGLPLRATLKQCQETVRKLHGAADGVKFKLEDAIKPIREAFKVDLIRYNALGNTMAEIATKLAEISAIDESNREDLQSLPFFNRYGDTVTISDLRAGQKEAVEENERKRKGLVSRFQSFDLQEEISLTLQEHIAQVLAGQSQELQQQILQNTDAHRSLDSAGQTRPPRPKLSKKPPFAKKDDIPLEVAGLIFSHCELESIVQLRQASSYWYSAFQSLDGVLKTKVLSRNPWMEPGENGTELETWGDCVLAFVGRLNSGKWQAVQTVDDIKLSPVGVKTATSVILATDTEKALGSGFKCLREPTTVKLIDNYDLELNILMACKTEGVDLSKQTLFVESDKIVVMFADPRIPQIKLPPPSFFGLPASVAESSLSVSVGDQHIVATFSGPEEIVYVMPREAPYYYYGQGFKYTADMGRDVTNYILPSAHALRLSNEEPDTKGTFFLSDMPHKRLVSLYEADSQSTPVAVYDGLLWVALHRRSQPMSLVPVLIDLKGAAEEADGTIVLSKVYWRESRVISGLKGRRQITGTAKSKNTHRYVSLCRDSEEVDIVDLATGTVTLVAGAGEVFPGFTDGRFEAWQYTDKTFGRFRRVFKRFRRRTPGLWQYGLSNLLTQDDTEWGYNRAGEWVALTEKELDYEDEHEEQDVEVAEVVEEDEEDEDEEEGEEEEVVWGTNRWGKWGIISYEELHYGEDDEEQEEDGWE